MPGKKEPGRFTISLNLEDPIQREVAQAINRQGPRRKAQFITNAISLHPLFGDAGVLGSRSTRAGPRRH